MAVTLKRPRGVAPFQGLKVRMRGTGSAISSNVTIGIGQIGPSRRIYPCQMRVCILILKARKLIIMLWTMLVHDVRIYMMSVPCAC